MRATERGVRGAIIAAAIVLVPAAGIWANSVIDSAPEPTLSTAISTEFATVPPTPVDKWESKGFPWHWFMCWDAPDAHSPTGWSTVIGMPSELPPDYLEVDGPSALGTPVVPRPGPRYYRQNSQPCPATQGPKPAGTA